jgi:hypothetical protein
MALHESWLANQETGTITGWTIHNQHVATVVTPHTVSTYVDGVLLSERPR